MKNWVYGTPSAWETSDKWKSHVEDSNVTGDEFESCLNELEKMLEKWLKENLLDPSSCYFRGDFYGDRTQYIDIDNISVLDTNLVRYIQKMLRELNLNIWRVALITPGSPGKAILIYVETVRYWGESHDELDSALTEIRKQMSKHRS